MTEQPDTRTPDRAATSPRTEAMRAIFERFFRRSPQAGYSWVEFEHDALTILEAAEAAQEAPAPEGLRAPHRHKHGAEFRFDHDHHWPHHHHFETSEPVWWEGPMPVAPPTPAEPPRPAVRCGNCGADLSALPPSGPGHVCPAGIGAEARPPEGLDAAWAAAEATLPEGWRVAVASRKDGYRADAFSGTEHQFEDHHLTPAAALHALAARLRSGAPAPEGGE